MVGFDLFFIWREAVRAEGRLFEVFEVRDVVPTFEVFLFFTTVVTTAWLPVITVGSTLVLVDTTRLGDTALFWIVVNFWFELKFSFVTTEGFVANCVGHELLFRCKSHVIAWMSKVNKM